MVSWFCESDQFIERIRTKIVIIQMLAHNVSSFGFRWLLIQSKSTFWWCLCILFLTLKASVLVHF